MTLRISAAQRADIQRRRLQAQMPAAAKDMFEHHEAEAQRYGSGPDDLLPHLRHFAEEVIAVGLRDPELRARLMLLAFLKYPKPWPAFLELPIWQRIRHSPGQADDLFEDFCSRLKYLSQSGKADIEVWW